MATILPDLSQQLAQMQKMIEAQQAEISRLQSAPRGNKLTLKVSDKTGALMVCGLQRFPTTLYVAQWERILAAADEMRAFIKAHPELSRKTTD